MTLALDYNTMSDITRMLDDALDAASPRLCWKWADDMVGQPPRIVRHPAMTMIYINGHQGIVDGYRELLAAVHEVRFGGADNVVSLAAQRRR